jgi:hypothetical protein
MKDKTFDLSDERRAEVERLMLALRPADLQGNVRRAQGWSNADAYWIRLNGCKLFAMVEVESVDGALWGHLSVSCKTPARVPSWAELGWCKAYFLGDRRAIQVLPPRAEYVNDNPHVLNLYTPLERNPLPDFRATVGDLGRLSI